MKHLPTRLLKTWSLPLTLTSLSAISMKKFKILTTQEVATVTTTKTYELPGFDKKYVNLKHVNTLTGEKSTDHYSLISPKAHRDYRPVVVRPEFLEWIKSNNPFCHKASTELIPDLKDVLLVDGEAWDVVFFNWSGNMLKDRDYKDIPYARSYDYIGSPFHNGAVDLDERFLAWLRNHPWLVSKPEEVEVLDVPYYNSNEEHRQYVHVVLCPDVKTYREMCDYYKKDRFPSCRVKDAVCGQTSRWGSDTPDWFGIRPWLRC
jgi:hypothetical protein